MATYRDLMRQPLPRRLAVASVPADFADWIDYAAVVSLLVFGWGAGPTVMAWFAVALSLPYIVIGPMLAVLVDRADTRVVLVLSNLGRAATTAALVWAAEPVALLGLVFLRGAIDSAFTPARQAAIRASTPDELLPVANGLHQAINQTSKILGPACGGLMLGFAAPQTVFAANACLSLLAALLFAGVALPKGHQEMAERLGFWHEAMGGFAEFHRQPVLRMALFFTAVAYFSFFLYDALIALPADDFGLGGTAFGLSIAASGAGGLVGSLLAGSLSASSSGFGSMRLMGLAALLAGAIAGGIGGMAIIGWPLPLLPFCLAMALAGGATAAMTVPYRNIVQTQTAPGRVARVFAAGEAVTVVAMLSAPFIGSVIAEFYGTGAAFAAGGVLLGGLGLVTLLRR